MKALAFLSALLLATSANAATYNFAKSHHATTIISIVDTATPTGVCVVFKIMNFSTTRMFWRADGTNPAVDQDGSWVVPPGGEYFYYSPDYNNPPSMKVVSGVAAQYSIECR